MYNAQQTAERIKHRAKEQKKLIKNMLEECQLSKNALSTMLSRSSWPSAYNMAKIADYLDCSVDYLLGRVEIPDAIHAETVDIENTDYIMTASRRETLLLIDYRNLNKQGKEYILQTMDMTKDKYKKHASISDMEDIG